MIGRWLKRLTRNFPVQKIRPEGRRYMNRYFLDGVPLEERRDTKDRWPIFLHEYDGCDPQDVLHDHPWKWAVGIVLCGGYTEERLVEFDPVDGWHTKVRRIRRLIPNFIGRRTFHRVAALKPYARTWTLFLHGPRHKSWGFLVRGVEVTDEGLRPCVVYVDWKRVRHDEAPRVIQAAAV